MPVLEHLQVRAYFLSLDLQKHACPCTPSGEAYFISGSSQAARAFTVPKLLTFLVEVDLSPELQEHGSPKAQPSPRSQKDCKHRAQKQGTLFPVPSPTSVQIYPTENLLHDNP